ncbi:MAG: HutD family protein [Pseudomonadota bacterium]
MQVLRASDREPEPWKNGRGETREIARCGPRDRFDWRVSVATIAESGPFSHFPDVIRSFVLLQGKVRLQVAGSVIGLDAGGAPTTFDGAADVDCALIEGPASALNVMTRCGKYSAEVLPLKHQKRGSRDGAVVIFTAPVLLASERLVSGDALLLEPGEAVPEMPAAASGWHILFREDTP